MPRHSLKGRKNIQALLNTGRRYSSSRLAVYLDKNRPDFTENYQVAFLLSGKSGNAVERNRVKRWLREDFRDLQNSNKINGAFVIRLKSREKTAGQMTHRELMEELEEIYKAIMYDG